VVNIVFEVNPQNINLGTCYTPTKRVAFVIFFKEYKDVFAWTYDDLKTFDMKIMQHVIPLNLRTTPAWRKLRKMHLVLEDGDIRLCIYFCNLNKAIEKYNYFVLLMEKILQFMVRLEMLSLLYGFSGYNQILVLHLDQIKIAFRTKWGTYA